MGNNKSSEPSLDSLTFVHIPKNAGTSIEDFGKQHGKSWGKYAKRTMKRESTQNKSCSIWHDPSMSMKNQSVNDNTFCVIRDPVDRFVSEYKYSRRKKGKCSPEALNQWAERALEDVSRNSNTSRNDCHLIPQSTFMANCDVPLRFDHLQQEFGTLLQQHGYTGDTILPHNNKSKHQACNVTTNDLHPDLMNKIQQQYRDDITLLQTLSETR